MNSAKIRHHALSGHRVRVEEVCIMKWRGHILCSGGMFSEVEGV